MPEEKERLEELAEELRPASVRPLAMDLTDRNSMAELKQKLEEEHACIRILINNAGSCSCGRFEEMTEQKIEQMIDLDITAMTLVNRVCIPFMTKGSYAILVSSIS